MVTFNSGLEQSQVGTLGDPASETLMVVLPPFHSNCTSKLTGSLGLVNKCFWTTSCKGMVPEMETSHHQGMFRTLHMQLMEKANFVRCQLSNICRGGCLTAVERQRERVLKG